MLTNKLIAENRIGKFAVSRRLIYDSDDTALRSLFGKMIIIDAKTDFQSDSVEYIALSPLFESSPLGVEPRWYRITITVGEDEKLLFGAEAVHDRWDASAEMSIDFGEISPK